MAKYFAKAGVIAVLIALICCTELESNWWLNRGVYAGQSNSAANDSLIQHTEPTDSEKKRKWKRGYVYVTKVIDGDTFWIDDGSAEIKVRFIGVDAPETRNTGRKKKGHYGAEAKNYVTRLTENKWVRLELDVRKIDPYKRLLAYVYLEDGTFLNAHLVANGYAVVDTHPPNVKYAGLFVNLQQTARRDNVGLWADRRNERTQND